MKISWRTSLEPELFISEEKIMYSMGTFCARAVTLGQLKGSLEGARIMEKFDFSLELYVTRPAEFEYAFRF